ncbi:MFS transporter [Streptacidiphilus sp. PB12-B1b]|uniref:MFS transporter n=1 Tax=Streptacidiphilus sp. PB12-B1b TaxID=2705012 RepID=UPI0015FB9EDB|nr:MFS transporter [Streptacidiphilus sp. PB12-B1b]QMU76275.1 MFS transporter [Streptacidiphilus sp. PB12-B1b]
MSPQPSPPPSSPSESAGRSALAPLRHPAFRALAAGRGISLIGNGVAPMALAFAVLGLTRSVSDLGLVVGSRSLFNVLFLLFGGVLADRLPRHLVLVGSGLMSAATQAAVATLVLTHHATMPLLMALSAANGVFAALALPASSALVPQTVPAELRQSANALNRMAANSSQILGASLGGILVAAVGPGWGLAVDATSFAVSALFFLRVRIPAAGAAGADGPAAAVVKRPGLVSELRDGWTEFASRTWVWMIVGAFGFINAAYAGAVQILGPSVAVRTFGSAGWGFVLASQTAGMVVGGLLALRIRPRRLLLVGVACMAGSALTPLGLGFQVPVYALALAGFVGGLCAEQFGVAWETSLQQEIPQAKLARVYSYDMLGSFVAIPVAQVATGPLTQALGSRATLFGAAGVIVAGTAAMVSVPDVRRLRARRAEPVAEPEPVGVADATA